MPTNPVMRLLSVAAIVPLLLTSCDSSSIFDPSDDAVGTYQLSVFAGQSMPNATFQCPPGGCASTGVSMPNGGTLVVVNGRLVLYDDGTFVETNNFDVTPSGEATQRVVYSSTGSYDVFDEELTLSDPSQDRFIEASLTAFGGDTRINYIEDGQAYEYRR